MTASTHPSALSLMRHFDVSLVQKVLNSVNASLLVSARVPTTTSCPTCSTKTTLGTKSRGLGQAVSDGFGSAQALSKPKLPPGRNTTTVQTLI